jgi:hypothetical protein
MFRRCLPLVVAVAAAALVSASPALASSPFGFQSFEASLGGDTQAGSHPAALTVSFAFNSAVINGHAAPVGGEADDLEVQLPPGLIGNPTAVPQCTRQQLDEEPFEGGCPADTQIGANETTITEGITIKSANSPVFNMVPPAGVPALFAAVVDHVFVFLEPRVRSGGDYGITVHVEKLPQVGIVSNITTIEGEPGGAPLLTMPTSCAAPLRFGIRANTWQDRSVTAEKSFELPEMTGCEHLSFPPSISAAPDTGATDTPAGLTFGVTVPQEGLLLPEGLSTADIQNTTVTLPEGFVINPGQAAGLQACKEGDVEGGDDLPLQHEQEDGEAEEEKFAGPPDCPDTSKVGTVQIKTPLLEGSAEKELAGSVYVLQSNPPNLKLLIAASGDGVNVKLVGDVHLNEATGQLTTTFTETPELPFTTFKLSFSGGAQAALDTPTRCGEYTTTSDFTPWNSPFTPDALPTSRLAIDTGPGGGACPSNPLPFSPELIAGATTDQAGGFTNFSLLLQRGDGQQRIEKLQFKEPAGLAGLISNVSLCPEPQAAQGTCSAASHIGHAVVASGPGPYPLVLPQPGDPELPIYLTGPYRGAPFGLSIVTPVIAGPFNLGTIITRATIEVDPRTAQITITTDPLPQVVDGVPTDLRSIQSVIDRPNFLFNPTNCEPQIFTGTAWGTVPPGASEPGETAPLSSHFGVGGCRELEFKPTLAVATAGKASKANGASLSFRIAYPKSAVGTQSWFNEAKFDLPKQLPARLTTLQKACLAATFESNRAACPAASKIGNAIVHTPVLPVPLTGPVYFVSYGGAKFPEAVMVLQGDGVTVELHGETFISNAGITSATFRNTPDVPFESIEVNIPTGPFSEFGTNIPAKDNYNLCGQKLVMPTLFKAQNGLEIHQQTPIAVTGCPKALTRAQLLAAALKACNKKPKNKRAACVKQARKRYGPKPKAKKGAKARN